jgi:hypothetical protein
MSDNVEQLTSDKQARDIGYSEGRQYRPEVDLNGVPLKEAAAIVRETFFENPHRRYRGPAVQHYQAWRKGFDAGYLGEKFPGDALY